MVLHEDFYKPRLPIHREQADVPEALPYSDEPISTFESSKGFPYTAEKLGYNENMRIDPHVEMKVRALDEHIQKIIQDERLRDSKLGFNTVFTRLIERSGLNFESMMRAGNQARVLDSLFMQVSLVNRMSSKTYLEHFSKQYNVKRVEIAKQQLRDALKAIL